MGMPSRSKVRENSTTFSLVTERKRRATWFQSFMIPSLRRLRRKYYDACLKDFSAHIKSERIHRLAPGWLAWPRLTSVYPRIQTMHSPGSSTSYCSSQPSANS